MEHACPVGRHIRLADHFPASSPLLQEKELLRQFLWIGPRCLSPQANPTFSCVRLPLLSNSMCRIDFNRLETLLVSPAELYNGSSMSLLPPKEMGGTHLKIAEALKVLLIPFCCSDIQHCSQLLLIPVLDQNGRCIRFLFSRPGFPLFPNGWSRNILYARVPWLCH